jgi:hypothetical protein
VIPPLSVGRSRLFGGMLELMAPYIQAVDLNHGYQFFAPQPDASHLVFYRAEFDDQREPIEGRFPDLTQQWPRQYYHRHFMLSEMLNMVHAQTLRSMPPPADPGMEELPTQLGPPTESLARCYANHLLHELEADRVSIRLVRHNFPSQDDVQVNHMPLDDPRLYQNLYEFTVSRDDR